MTLSISRVLADAWALWRRDRDLLVSIGAPFLFLPAWALRLLLPVPITPETVELSAVDQVRRQMMFLGDHAIGFVLAGLVAQLGIATLTAFYCDRNARDVQGALRRGLALWPRFILAAFLVEALALLGLAALIVGAALVLGRALVTGPALVAGQPVSAVGAIARSVRLTAGNTATATALALIVALGGLLAAYPFDALDAWLRTLHAPNPVALAVIDAAAAGVATLAAIAAVLVAVSAYRALASRGI